MARNQANRVGELRTVDRRRGALRKRGGPNSRSQDAKDELSGLHEKRFIFVSAALTCVSRRARRDGLAVHAYLTVTANRNQRRTTRELRESDGCSERTHTSLCLATPDGFLRILESGRDMRKVEMCLVTVCQTEVAEPPASQ